MTAVVNRIRFGTELIVVTSSMAANGRKLWEPEPVDPETWTPASVAAEVWTPQPSSSATWTQLN